MTRQTYTLELITPCFCAGANPAEAEIRAPSIRGQLRWWLRALGGNAADETAVFGAVAGEAGVGSALRIVIADYRRGPVWNPPIIDQNSDENYTWHFASASGKPANAGPKTGPRWKPKGAIPPKSSFNVVITQIRPLSQQLQERLDLALAAFLCFGTIGLRATRGLGAFYCKQSKPWRDLIRPLTEAGFQVCLRAQPDSFNTWDSALRDWSAWLRHKLRKEHKAERYSALGGIHPRQASAVRFRPLLLETGQLTWVALEAPHNRVLGRSTSKILIPKLFEGPAPTAPPRRR